MRSGVGVHRQYGDHHAVDGQVPAVAQHLVGHLACARSVYEHAPRANRRADPAARFIEADPVAVLCQQHGRTPAAHLLGEPRMVRQIAVLSMYRHEATRTD